VTFTTHCSLSVTDLSRCSSPLEPSQRVWTSVFTDSSSSDHQTRRTWQRQKKHEAHMLETCLRKLRLAQKVMLSTRTRSDTVTASELICRNNPLLPNDDWLYFKPVHSNSVLSAFCGRHIQYIVQVRRQWLSFRCGNSHIKPQFFAFLIYCSKQICDVLALSPHGAEEVSHSSLYSTNTSW